MSAAINPFSYSLSVIRTALDTISDSLSVMSDLINTFTYSLFVVSTTLKTVPEVRLRQSMIHFLL